MINLVNTKTPPIRVETGNTGAFLSLPETIYPVRSCPRNTKEESKLLSGTHVLSKYFNIYVFTAFRNSIIVSRCAITIYPDDQTAYLGFFDSKDDGEAVAALFTAAENFARSNGLDRVAGPVDGSFWLNYRMKVNLFDDPPYFGEPCGLPWYQKLWEQNGYAATDTYTSNIYRVASKEYVNKKYQDRLAAFIEKGYKIISPKGREWNTVIGEVYNLIMRLYSDFPIFKAISEEDFRKHCAGLKHILDFSMVKIAYFNGLAVGFFISAPDYGYMLNRPLSPLSYIPVFFKKKLPSRYVMLYMGVDREHKGLGKAVAQTIIDRLRQKRSASIGALIHEGKVTERYAEDMIEGKYRYMLFEKHL